ncbi:14607_t:CDS:2, partial [Cetraspora pellucida]
MFVCSVYKRNFRCLTSLKNHRKVHKTYYYIEYYTATSSNKSMNNCSSDKTKITYDKAPEFESIVINNQQIAYNYDQIFEENNKFGHIIEENSKSNQMFENNILENDKISEEICSNDSELSDIDNAEFPNTAYRDFIDI